MTDSGYCRLCAEIKLCSNLIPINKNDDEINTNLCYKISQCFQIQITSDDNLPKTICLDCCTQTNGAYELFQKVHKAQEFLRDVVFNSSINNKFSIGFISPTIQTVTNSTSHDSETVNTKIEDEINIKTETNPDYVPDIEITEGLWDDDNDLDYSPNQNNTKSTRKKTVKKSTSKKKESEKRTNRHKREGPYIKQHFEQEWKDFIWRCNVCSKELSTRKELIEHFEKVHEKTPEYTCLYCPKSYIKYTLFTRHVRTHKNQNKFSCNVCNKKFHEKRHMRDHIKFYHDEVGLSKYVCPVCGKAFKWPKSFKYHTMNFHVPVEEKWRYECEICRKRLTTEEDLIEHKKVHDESNKHFTCDKCGSRFRLMKNLETHVLNVHTEYSEDKYLQCPLCPAKLKHKVQLRRHKREIHSTEKRFECETCGKKYYLLSKFKLHMTLHTGERPFKCQYCDKCFRIKKQLVNHTRQHTGEKPYCCFECNHYFTDFANYIKHMRRKHGVTSFKNVKKVTDVKVTDLIY